MERRAGAVISSKMVLLLTLNDIITKQLLEVNALLSIKMPPSGRIPQNSIVSAHNVASQVTYQRSHDGLRHLKYRTILFKCNAGPL